MGGFQYNETQTMSKYTTEKPTKVITNLMDYFGAEQTSVIRKNNKPFQRYIKTNRQPDEKKDKQIRVIIMDHAW